MDNQKLDIFSFLAVWFNNLRKNVFKVEVQNPTTLNTRALESKLEDVAQALKELPEERSSVIENRMKEYIKLSAAVNDRKIVKAEITNLRYPELKIPNKQEVHGSISVSNLPKVQEIKGDVGVKDINAVIKGLQVVVDAINDLKLDFAQSLKTNIGGMFGVAGSRDSQKITDGTKNATLTTVSGSNAVDVNVVQATGVEVTGSVTANAGTNLNTSLLALESGGNLATAVASLGVMDDWDNAASDGASVSGDVAHDSTDAGEPVKVGYKAYSPDGTTPGTAVAENDRTHGKSDLDGRHFVNDEHPRWWSYHSDGSTALTDASVQADPGDGFQIVITSIAFSSGAATAINMFLEEGSTKIIGPWYLEAVAGRGLMTPSGFKKHVTASTALTVTTSAAIAHSVDIQGYIQAV